MGNEPSFLSPNLYHWIGRADPGPDCIQSIVKRAYNDTLRGIPGNDDPVTLSSWLVFRMQGLHANAGQSYYLINTPLFTESTLLQTNGKAFRFVARSLSATNKYITGATLDGKPLPRAWIEHAEIVRGVVPELEMSELASDWERPLASPSFALQRMRSDPLFAGRYYYGGNESSIPFPNRCHCI